MVKRTEDQSAAISKAKPRGRAFKPGKSGNPSGRPKDKVTLDDGTVVSLRALARGHTKVAFDVLVKAMKNEDLRIASSAAEAILSRGWGKAPQAITGEDGEGPVQYSATIVFK